MTRKKRNYENEYSYDIVVTGWDAHVAFNEYAYINIFDSEPFEDRIYICLNGSISSASSKKLKKGTSAEVVLHPSTRWEKFDWEKRDSRIGDLILHRNPAKLIARISLPIRSYELIKSYMAYKPIVRIELVGTEISRRKADIFYFCYDSKELGAEN